MHPSGCWSPRSRRVSLEPVTEAELLTASPVSQEGRSRAEHCQALPESLWTTGHSLVDLKKQVEPSLGPGGMASGGTIQSIVREPCSKVRWA